MPLKLKRRPGRPHWYLHGTIRGITIRESTGVTDQKAAEAIKARREWEIVQRSVFGAEAPATLNRQVYTPIAAVLNHAAKRGLCTKRVIERPTLPLGRIRRLTFEEAERLIEACAHHLRPLVVFLLGTGARLSEALYLDWREVDLARGHVAFVDTKNGEPRGVPLHSRVVNELRVLRHREGRVFRTQKGRPYAEKESGGGQIKTAFRGACRRAGITDFSPHDCRHTWATWHYAANRDLIT